MKLIIAILRDTDNDPVSHALTASDYRVTCIASTGGFWRRGQSTLLVGCDDTQVEVALEIIRKNITQATESDKRQSFIFVLKVDQYTHF